MRDRPVIVFFLLAFVAVASLPAWYNRVAGAPRATALALKMPQSARACVAPLEQMRTSHMKLLASWREDVVRRGDRVFVAHDGTRHEKSLVKTCIGCHQSKADFCDRCHDRAGVKPGCGNCHVMEGRP